ncbi:hypothetical protein [Brachyspira alvinipulli]|uniref:hypothetical protein n=1 Tax=Brachyspira alvinipulli TaxID=84379 RepID=UPI000484A1A3|nr:hypothetical protein [Brachyspira alvinipulli]
MKKIILFLLSINLLWAYEHDKAYFSELLRDNGKVTKNTLKVKNIDDTYSVSKIYFSGEITLTGVLERTDNCDGWVIYSGLRFHPDNNIGLPFLFSTYCLEYLDDDVEFGRWNFGVLLENIKVKLPEPLKNKRFLGAAAVRAEVTIRNYHFYGAGEAGGEAYGELVNFKLLGDIKTEYFTKDNYNNRNYYGTLEYNSKDDYVNIRDKANGKIIGKILKNDMINNGGLLLEADVHGKFSDWEKNWIEVYYMPPNAKDGKDAIYGFVHGSQIKLENRGY